MAGASNDKPELKFGLPLLDELGVRRVLQAIAPLRNRHYVVMEVRANLLKDERIELLAKWSSPMIKKVGVVLVGEPPQAMKEIFNKVALKAKQVASDNEFR